jgi:hypothetical protein
VGGRSTGSVEEEERSAARPTARRQLGEEGDEDEARGLARTSAPGAAVSRQSRGLSGAVTTPRHRCAIAHAPGPAVQVTRDVQPPPRASPAFRQRWRVAVPPIFQQLLPSRTLHSPRGACTGAPSSAPERLAPELAAAAATGAARSISCAYPDPGHRLIWARTVSALKRWTRTRSKRGWSERIDLKVADWCQMGELSVRGVPFWR